jgi:uncharacterized membrane protein required for colicin V production
MFDIIILLIIAGFVWKGVRLGFIEALGGIIGVFVGLLAAGRWWQLAADSLLPILDNNQWLSTALGWLLVFIVVNRLVALIFWFIDKVFHVIAIIPFLKSINSLLGGLLGLVEGVFVVGSIISIMLLLPFSGSLQTKVNNSKFSNVLSVVGVYAQKLTPDSVKNWKSGLPFMNELNQLQNGSLKQLNPFKGFGTEFTGGIDFLQKQMQNISNGQSTTTKSGGTFDDAIPDDAFEPTPAE